MLAQMSWAQLREWAAYSELDPFGEERADLRMGILASVMANVHRDTSKRPRPYQADEFMPKFGEQAADVTASRSSSKPLTDKDEWAAVKRMARSISKAKG